MIVTISSQADCDRIFGAHEVNFERLAESARQTESPLEIQAIIRFPEEKPPAGHHAPAAEESEFE